MSLHVVVMVMDDGDVGRGERVFGPFGSSDAAYESLPRVARVGRSKGYTLDVDMSLNVHELEEVPG